MTDSSDRGIIRSLYFNRTGILLLCMLIASIAVIFVAVHVHGNANNFWLGLGGAVLAASVFSFFQVLLTTRQFDNFISGTIRGAVTDEISKATQVAMEEFRKLQTQYVPLASYPAVSSPDKRFNQDVNLAVRSSGHYTFYGLTARFAIARLASLPTQVPSELKFVIADPTQDGVVDNRARREAVVGDEAAFTKAKEELLRGIYVSFAGMYLTRRRFDRAEICLTDYPPIDRAELCDGAVFVALFSDGRESTAPFPSTLQFHRDSVIYKMFEHECNRLFSSPLSKRISITSNTTEGDFLNSLASAGIRIAQDDWEKLKSEFTQFRDRHRSGLVP